MRIISIGGGPVGLYASILIKRSFPSADITVYERNRVDDTFGWGVVFSDETLDNIAAADPESFREIENRFVHWTDIRTHYQGHVTKSTGHGFSGLSRKGLLQILSSRAIELGVDVRFETEITDLESVRDADLVLAADGVNSMVRSTYENTFKPTLDWRKCKFSWLGTSLPLDAFTFIFKENEHGLFQVHAYPFEDGLSTWIVECREEVWKRAGLDSASEEETVSYCEDLFKEYLNGHPLLNNRSVWRTFPTITCERWHHENIALLGDAVHTAHFSIGSGTKLAMETAISLRDALQEHEGKPIPEVLGHWQESREVDVLKTQKAAQTSLEWFENSARYMGQHPEQFTFNLMTRSKRITYANLKERDPDLVRRTSEVFRQQADAPLTSEREPPPPAFTPFSLRTMNLDNRIVVSPMCQYSATEGLVGDWHLIHLGSRALGGAGLILTEMTNVSRDGRITPGCAGLYTDEHTAAWKRIVDFVHDQSRSRIGIQLAHAGRKGSTQHPWSGRDVPLLPQEGGWTTIGPDSNPFEADWPKPKAMTRSDMDRVRDDFVAATARALEAGFDCIELHMAHGYLLSSFLSPASNSRTDEYGGSLKNRMRFPLEVLDAVRAAWPSEHPLLVRISATDWLPEGGFTSDDSILLAQALKERGCDAIDVSTAGNTPKSKPIYGRMYQVPFAERIRHEVDIPIMAVGAILGIDHANTVIGAGRADLACMARPHLRDPHLTLRGAQACGFPDQWWPGPYLAGKSAPPTS